jgi:hypothetical protein
VSLFNFLSLAADSFNERLIFSLLLFMESISLSTAAVIYFNCFFCNAAVGEDSMGRRVHP